MSHELLSPLRYTDFDPMILEGPTASYLPENKVSLRGAPSGHLNQNGLVEQAWQTITNMGRAFITDMQMPRQYRYWALRQSVQVMNYIPCTVEGISTTPHELVYGVKPDLQVLFQILSTGFFRHLRDGTHHRSGISESKTMQGMALGRCRKSDGMIFYCPHTKQTYTSSDYKLDEGRNTPNAFNLCFIGGIFVGLYNPSTPNSSIEPYPEGTQVSFPTQSSSDHSTPVLMRGTHISVPIPCPNTPIPASDATSPPYVVHLVDGSVHQVSPDVLATMVIIKSASPLGLVTYRMSCIFTRVYTRKASWNGTWITLPGASPNALVMVQSFLVSLSQTFVSPSRNTLMMALSYLAGMGGITSLWLVSSNMYLLLVFIALLLRVLLAKLFIVGILTKIYGLLPIRKNMKVYSPILPLMSSVRLSITPSVSNMACRQFHPCAHLLLRRLMVYPSVLKVASLFSVILIPVLGQNWTVPLPSSLFLRFASSPPLRFITNVPLNKGTASLPSFKLLFLTMRLPL